MGWFLWGIAFGWAVCAIYHHSQSENEKASNGAAIIFFALVIVALVISISLGITDGTLVSDRTPTPTSLGR